MAKSPKKPKKKTKFKYSKKGIRHKSPQEKKKEPRQTKKINHKPRKTAYAKKNPSQIDQSRLSLFYSSLDKMNKRALSLSARLKEIKSDQNKEGELKASINELAKQSKELAAHLRLSQSPDLVYNSKRIDNLREQARAILEALPDSILALNKKSLDKKLKAISRYCINTRQVALKTEQDLAKANKKAQSMEQSLISLQQDILHKNLAKNHPTYLITLRLLNALEASKSHLVKVFTEKEKRDFQQKSNQVASAILRFMSSTRFGRMYIDQHWVQLRAELGEAADFENDKYTKKALEIIFSNSNLWEPIQRIDSHRHALTSTYKLSAGIAGSVIEFDAGERKIRDGFVILTPIKAREKLTR